MQMLKYVVLLISNTLVATKMPGGEWSGKARKDLWPGVDSALTDGKQLADEKRAQSK